MPLTVKKDFLEEPVFEQIKNIILSNNFNWFFQNEQNKLAKDGFFFSHKLYAEDRIESDFFNFIIPHLKKQIDYQSLRRCTINLLTPSNNKSIFHTDSKDERITTGILYINKNNGYTEFENGKKVKSNPNTFVQFSSELKHRAFSQTDANCRVVLNMNYYK